MGENFNMGAFDDWNEVGNGEVLRFELPASGVRNADFQIMADDLVSVVATVQDGRALLVGYGSGLISVKFAMVEESQITVMGPDGCSIWIKTKVGTQVLSESGEASFTDIEPRRMTTSEKITRVQQIMATNAQRRYDAQMAGLAAIQADISAKVALLASSEPVVEPLDGAD